MSADALVVLIGAGGHARVLREALLLTETEVKGFVAPEDQAERMPGLAWLGEDDVLPRLDAVLTTVNAVGSVGDLRARARVHDAVTAAGLERRTVIHPAAIVSPSARVDAGAQILASAVVGTGARIGADAIVNTAAVVEHDATIGAVAHIASGAVLAGGVTVGERTHIGLGARVIQGVRIGSDCVVGAGAVVLRDVADGTKVAGVPARTL